MSGRSQDSISRIGGLSVALEMALTKLAEEWGGDAPAKLEQLRDEVVQRFKNAGIPAERELDHAAVVGPSLEAIETVFNTVINDRKRPNG